MEAILFDTKKISRNNSIILCSQCHFVIFESSNVKIVWKGTDKQIDYSLIYDALQQDVIMADILCDDCLKYRVQTFVDKYTPYYAFHANKIKKWWKTHRYHPKSPYTIAYGLLSSVIHGFKLDTYSLPAKLLKYNIYHVTKQMDSSKLKELIGLQITENTTLFDVIKCLNIGIKLECKSLLDLSLITTVNIKLNNKSI